MTWSANAPDAAVALRTVLVALGVTQSAVHYPEVDEIGAATTAYLVTIVSSRQISLVIVSTALDIGQLEQAAQALRFSLPSRYRSDGTGLVIGTDIDVGEAGEPSDGEIAGGSPACSIELTIPYGPDLG
jgi:hypothetical protein